MASSLESNRRRTCCSVSGELVHPMSGSTALGEVCSKSSTHDLVLAVPACIAVLAGLYMRAVVMVGGALWRISLLSPLAYRNRLGGQGGATISPLSHTGWPVHLPPLWAPCGGGRGGGRAV